MSNKDLCKEKHLNIKYRLIIEYGLDQNYTLKEIADRVGRTFNDFIKFIEDNPNLPVVEMDTVHSTRSSKVLLTLMFKSCSLMLAFIIDSCSQIAVKDVIDKLYEVLAHDVFKRSFPAILTDNGSEFKSPESFDYKI